MKVRKALATLGTALLLCTVGLGHADASVRSSGVRESIKKGRWDEGARRADVAFQIGAAHGPVRIEGVEIPASHSGAAGFRGKTRAMRTPSLLAHPLYHARRTSDVVRCNAVCCPVVRSHAFRRNAALWPVDCRIAQPSWPVGMAWCGAHRQARNRQRVHGIADPGSCHVIPAAQAQRSADVASARCARGCDARRAAGHSHRGSSCAIPCRAGYHAVPCGSTQLAAVRCAVTPRSVRQ